MFKQAGKVAIVVALILQACSDNPANINQTSETAVSQHSLNGNHALQSSDFTVVMSGLENPRGLGWGPEGALYVTEAGTPAHNGECFGVPRGTLCYSGTGAVTRLWRGNQARVVSGLASNILLEASEITGPHHISFQGRGGMYVTTGWGAEPDLRNNFTRGDLFGTIHQITPGGQYKVVSDVAAFEQNTNPDGTAIDSNPYGILSEPGRHYVVDAGGNSLVEVRANGRISLVAVFENVDVPPPLDEIFPTAEAVPTQIRRGPDGALYVSTLTGVPFHPGSAAIYRISHNGTPEIFAGNLTTITDFDFDRNGNIYAVGFGSEPFFGGTGTLTKIDTDGNAVPISEELLFPTGVLVGPDGEVYVSNKGVIPGEGEVLRFNL